VITAFTGIIAAARVTKTVGGVTVVGAVAYATNTATVHVSFVLIFHTIITHCPKARVPWMAVTALAVAINVASFSPTFRICFTFPALAAATVPKL
jgi:hypothetical protein